MASSNQDQVMFVLDCSRDRVCPCVCSFMNLYTCCVNDSLYAFDSHTTKCVCTFGLFVIWRKDKKEKDITRE